MTASAVRMGVPARSKAISDGIKRARKQKREDLRAFSRTMTTSKKELVVQMFDRQSSGKAAGVPRPTLKQSRLSMSVIR